MRFVPKKTTKRALRAQRHRERHSRHAEAAGEKNTPSSPPASASPGIGLGTTPQKSLVESGVVVEPTNTPAKGVYLISHPLSYVHAPGEVFHRSVVLLVHHDEAGDEGEGGSYGLVVNKDKGQTLEEVFCGNALPLASNALERLFKNPVRVGGPMMPRLAWLHRHEEVGGVRLAEEAEKPVRIFSRISLRWFYFMFCRLSLSVEIRGVLLVVRLSRR